MTRQFLPVLKPALSGDEAKLVTEVLKSGWWTTGPRTAEFEERFADYLHHDRPLYCVGLTSCTAALHLALVALGIGSGDEVIVPTWTFAATAHVVEWVGARPILCDVDQNTLNIDCATAEKLVTERTKAIMPVHLAGYPCDMAALTTLAERHGLAVVEDAAHAAGTAFEGVRVGASGNIVCFSFFATKNLAMGEGGALVSPDRDLVERVRRLGYFGIDPKAFETMPGEGPWRYDIRNQGFKYNMDSLHAAIGLAQLEKLEERNEYRRILARIYREGLDPMFGLFEDDPRHTHSHHIFIILLPENVSRLDFHGELRDRGVGTGVHYVPLHHHTHYANHLPGGSLPVADRLAGRVITIPMHPNLTEDDARYVVEVCNGTLERLLLS